MANSKLARVVSHTLKRKKTHQSTTGFYHHGLLQFRSTLAAHWSRTGLQTFSFLIGTTLHAFCLCDYQEDSPTSSERSSIWRFRWAYLLCLTPDAIWTVADYCMSGFDLSKSNQARLPYLLSPSLPWAWDLRQHPPPVACPLRREASPGTLYRWLPVLSSLQCCLCRLRCPSLDTGTTNHQRTTYLFRISLGRLGRFVFSLEARGEKTPNLQQMRLFDRTTLW